jgi:biofilm PGA synthesis N-glycosyltransferase PgaC
VIKVDIKEVSSKSINEKNKVYFSVWTKFIVSQIIAVSWLIFSIYLSLPWIRELEAIVGRFVAVLIVAGIGYIPGYINSFVVMSLIFDRQPKLKTTNPYDDVTIIVACRNEEKQIKSTLQYIAKQDYEGSIHVIVVDNASTDETYKVAKESAKELGMDVFVVKEGNPGKFNALNTALNYVVTDYVMTLDADTLLHKSAVRYIVSRIKSAPDDVCAVAGSVLVKNSRTSFVAKLQEWDYFLGISSIKRMQGLYQGTLVAQGAFSLYKTEALRAVKGWPDAIGEDIVLTWRFLKNNWRVFYEPHAISFTDVPLNLKHLGRQRSRWARGMIEALREIKPWNHPIKYVRFMTGINLIMPYIDFVYTFIWMPGLVLALFGNFAIVGPMTLLVLPITIIQNYVIYKYQASVFKNMGLRIRKNRLSFVVYTLCYQMIMSPMSVIGYIQELLYMKRVWK